MMVAVLLFVLELRDRLVFVDFLGALARLGQVALARVLGADRHLRQQLRQIAASAFAARRRRVARADQGFELVSAVPALVFVERHKRFGGARLPHGPSWSAKGLRPASHGGSYHRRAITMTVLVALAIGAG